MTTTPPTPGPSFDPGLTQRYTGPLLRSINKDGSFNVHRRGLRGFAANVYAYLVTTSWTKFLGLAAAGYLIVNAIFAGLYLTLGADALHASERDLGLGPFARAFFFSAQTLTTVGYGSIYPFGLAANILAAIEGALGLTGFALTTGMVFARFSRPTAKLVFSDRMIVTPYRGGTSLQFRIANQRRNVLMELEADVILMTVEKDGAGQLKRNFVELRLERRNIFFLALTWTIVHPIDESSPLWGKTASDLERLQSELLIMIKGYDDSFTQVVHTRYSYRWDEIEWSARFVPAFEASPAGHLVLDVGKISHIARV